MGRIPASELRAVLDAPCSRRASRRPLILRRQLPTDLSLPASSRAGTTAEPQCRKSDASQNSAEKTE